MMKSSPAGLPDTTIVIPQRGQGLITAACLQALQRYETSNWPIIVVDDGSADASAELVSAAATPRCRLIRQPPRGVTAAWNFGLTQVETKYALLLNNDVIIEGPLADELAAPLRTGQAGITGAEWRTEPLTPDQRVLAGWCLAFRVDVWRGLGGFDDTLRLYFADADFQLRARRIPRWPGARCCEVPMRHLAHQTSKHDPKTRTQWHADQRRFADKWGRSR